MRLALTFVLASLALPASAIVIFSNGGPDLALPDAVSSDFSGGDPYPFRVSEIADQFSLSVGNTSVTAIKWWGGYADSNTPVSDNFTIRIYANDATGPDEVVFQTAFTGAAARNNTGVTITQHPFEPSGFDIYEYSAFVSLAPFQPNKQYWLSIVNDTSDDFDDSWFWSTSNGAVGDGRRRVNGSGQFYVHEGLLGRGSEFAFELISVPEPITAALIAIGIVGMRYSRRKN